jgi:hypothetical protein
MKIHDCWTREHRAYGTFQKTKDARESGWTGPCNKTEDLRCMTTKNALQESSAQRKKNAFRLDTIYTHTEDDPLFRVTAIPNFYLCLFYLRFPQIYFKTLLLYCKLNVYSTMLGNG